MTEHSRISFVKSAMRIAGLVSLLASVKFGIFVLVWAELIGILEEM